LVNPCGAAVNWTLRLYVDNRTLGSRPGGRLAAEVPADMAPYSVAPVYVFGVAEEAGLYRVSYRLYVRPGVYDVWGYRVVVDRERLVAANGSFVNWVWGSLESLAGRAAGDRCAEARGAGRRWAAERIGWAGVATEVDTALGGAALLFSAGTYGEGRTAARGVAETVKVAEEAARGYKAARAVAYAYRLWQGVLLGWDVYLSVARGEVPVEVLGAAVASVGGRVGERVRLVYSLATGGLLLMNLGDVPEMEELVRGIYDEASKYGEYAHCFVDGALGAFDAYAKEVLANQLVGVFSTFLDIDKVLNNKAYKGYLQLAALAAFDYEQPVPVFRVRELLKRIGGGVDAVMFGKHIIGVRETGDVAVMKARDNGRRFEVTSLKLQSSATISSGGGYEIRISKYKAGTASYLVSEVVDINTKRRIVVGYNDMFTALAIARGFRGDIYRGVYKDHELYIINYDFDRSLIDTVGAYPETFYKYLSTALMPEIVGVNPAAVGAEVTLPAVFDKRWRWDLVIADTAFGKTAFVPLRSEGFRVDILGILDDGRLLIGEVKNMEDVGGPVDLELGDVAERAKVLGDLLRDNSALLSALVSVYNGGRLPGGGKVSSSFMASQVLMFPDLRKIFGQGGVKFVVVAAGARRAVVFVYDVSLDQLQDRGFLDRVAEEVFYGFKLAEARERLYSIDEAVRRVVDRYGAYTKYVEFLKS